MSMLEDRVRRVVATSRKVAGLSSDEKNALLEFIAEELTDGSGAIITANRRDVDAEKSLHGNANDRLVFEKDRLDASIKEVHHVAELKDYVGEIIEEIERPNGLRLERTRVPLGVILMIYEARPNVTIDSTILALKSGNAVILKGGSEALETNRAIVECIWKALDLRGLPRDAVMFVDSTDRNVVGELLQMKSLIDVVIPRGGKGLIDFVARESLVPVIETGASVVHMYIDEKADIEKAVAIAVNAKTRRVGICNALDVLLVHRAIAEKFLRAFASALLASSRNRPHPVVELRCDEAAMCILRCETCGGSAEEACSVSKNHYPKLAVLDPARDFDTEFLDYILSVHIVDSLDEATSHIDIHSLKHSECIVTESAENAEEFLRRVDSACVYWNASTQFSDGAQFGLGAEIGISTQKLHARGPFALEGLTTYKWKIRGSGQVRPG
jgi:glutamate-5-semialdehyde dehydrogenase